MARKIFGGAPAIIGADGPITQLSDVITPEIFGPYAQLMTEEKSNLIRSGAVARNAAMDAYLAGGGLTFELPRFNDLDNDEANVSTDAADDEFTGGSANATPKKTSALKEIAVRLNRNNSWSSADLAAQLIGADPMQSIASRVGSYWDRQMQRVFIATMRGVFADNDAAPSGGDTHAQGDLTVDVKGTGYIAGTTDFTSGAFIDALTTMGDSDESLGLVMVHSIVYARMRKNNLIDFIPDARGEVTIPTFMGRTVIRDDNMPNNDGVFESWFFGPGAVQMGVGSPKVPVETERRALSGNGGGSEILVNRVEWSMHPIGHQFIGTAASGGPSNAATTNNLAHAGSWRRVYKERKQIPVARLITRERAPA